MPRRKVPGADYAVRDIDPRELPADVEEQPAAAAPVEPMLDIRTLHNQTMPQLLKIAQELEVEGAPALRKQELIFKILQTQTERLGLIFSEGVLEVLPDGFGFLRAAEYNYLAGPGCIFFEDVENHLVLAHRAEVFHAVFPGHSVELAHLHGLELGDVQRGGDPVALVAATDIALVILAAGAGAPFFNLRRLDGRGRRAKILGTGGRADGFFFRLGLGGGGHAGHRPFRRGFSFKRDGFGGWGRRGLCPASLGGFCRRWHGRFSGRCFCRRHGGNGSLGIRRNRIGCGLGLLTGGFFGGNFCHR
jgi:hypothetical protein